MENWVTEKGGKFYREDGTRVSKNGRKIGKRALTSRENLRGKPDSTGRFPAGNPGRPKGTPNKVTGHFRGVLSEAFEQSGGVSSLVRWIKNTDHLEDQKNRGKFYSFLVSILPKSVNVSGSMTHSHLDKMSENELIEIIRQNPDSSGRENTEALARDSKGGGNEVPPSLPEYSPGPDSPPGADNNKINANVNANVNANEDKGRIRP